MEDKNWENYFEFLPVVVDGKEYSLKLNDVKEINKASGYWHGKGDPSSWLSIEVFHVAKRKFPELSELDWLKIAAAAMGMEVQTLISAIKWHENYMRWHDGDEGYTVLEGEYK